MGHISGTVHKRENPAGPMDSLRGFCTVHPKVSVFAFIQSLEECVYVLNVNAWIDSEIMAYQSLTEQIFATGNATWPGIQ